MPSTCKPSMWVRLSARTAATSPGALAGLLMFLVAALMATVSIIVISAAKIMIGVLVIFAPVAIACTLFKVTARSLTGG